MTEGRCEDYQWTDQVQTLQKEKAQRIWLFLGPRGRTGLTSPPSSPQNGKRTPPVFRILMNSEQTRLAKQVVQTNNLSFSSTPPFTGLKYIAGVDISFVKTTNKACAMLAILNFPDLTLAYKTYNIVEMTEEYIPFYLAFREVGHLIRLFERVKQEVPECYPQVVFVDGAGVWHPKGPLPI